MMSKFLLWPLKGVLLSALFMSTLSFAGIIVHQPSTVIIGSGISRPEGIAFSPSGKLLAVANATGNRITFYKINENGMSFYNKPFFTLEGASSHLSYPHDVCFSLDGSHVAVTNSLSNAITIYKKNDFCYDLKPITTIQGEQSELLHPNSVRYAPQGNFIAVANLLKNTISFYRYHGDVYEQEPYQVIESVNHILDRPDGLSFTTDGELLAVTSHDGNAVAIYQQVPNSEGLYSQEPVEIIQGEGSNLLYPHSVSFHPTNKYLAVSSAGGKKTLNIFQKVSDEFPRYSHFPAYTVEVYNPMSIHLQSKQPHEGGVKGIAFSNDGTFLGICASDIAHSDRTIFIFPVEIIQD